MVSLAALGVEVGGGTGSGGTKKRVVQALRFTILLSVVYGAWDKHNKKMKKKK